MHFEMNGRLMNILCVGDIVGKPGREAFLGLFGKLKEELSVDFCVVNGENAAAGAGITSKLAQQLLDGGCDVITLGDHAWDQKELRPFLEMSDRIIRPANFPEGAPGRGWVIHQLHDGTKIAVINLIGRVFMRYQVDCPFKAADRLLKELKGQADVIIIDFHAEATSEKVAFGHYVSGRVSAVIGTHTHIPTADAKILGGKTAYITDMGMTGPYDSVIGQKIDQILSRFLTSLPNRFQVAQGDVRLNGVLVSVDSSTGNAEKILRIEKNFEHKKEPLSSD